MVDYAAHFNNLYRARCDPWNYADSVYETRKYDATLAALTRPRYASALKPGVRSACLQSSFCRLILWLWRSNG